MLIFREILRTYEMDEPIWKFEIRLGHAYYKNNLRLHLYLSYAYTVLNPNKYAFKDSSSGKLY